MSRRRPRLRFALRAIPMFAGSALLVAAGASALQHREGMSFPNRFGVEETVSSNGRIDLGNPFFQDLGSNGRRCVTCHEPQDNWSVSADHVRERFEATGGLDPIFRPVDGANSPLADVSTVRARRRAYSMLISKGVVRIQRPVPPNAEFELVSVDDPYHYASAAGLSLFRRPLPSTNLRFLSTVMWDGREVDPANPMKIANSPEQNMSILRQSLAHQAQDANNDHAQGANNLTQEQLEQITDFELGLATAQRLDYRAGRLDADGASGGPLGVLDAPFYIGINDNVNDPNGAFDANSMRLYREWLTSRDPQRRAIARGAEIFNSKTFQITGVAGLNDNPYFGSPPAVTGTCTTCHNAPNIGDHSLAIALNIGVADGSRRTPDMPLYTFRNKSTGELVSTTDPGLALSTGKWSDIGRFKGPVLRGLAGRAPYFHNGSAADLDAVLDFYQDRFGVTFTRRERRDLIAFLNSL